MRECTFGTFEVQQPHLIAIVHDDLVMQYLAFENVKAPLALDGVPELVDIIDQVLHGWPHYVVPQRSEEPPFFVISRADRPGRYLCEDRFSGGDKRILDPINAVCDMVAALPFALADTDSTLLCLHAAAVEISGRIVIFPNPRRAGKSTFVAALASQGFAVVSDDFLPISFDQSGAAFGHPLGISPRLRVPLPEDMPASLKDWLTNAPGPENKHYKYLTLSNQTVFGRTLPIAGFVMLDRQETADIAEPVPVSADAAINALLHQNFTRDRHSADILALMAGFLAEAPVFRFTYGSVRDAAGFSEAFDNRHLPAVTSPELPFTPFRMAELNGKMRAALDFGANIERAAGVVERIIGNTLYLTDAEGHAIHKMDPLAGEIWRLFETPQRIDDLQHILAEAFTTVSPDQIAKDLEKLINEMAKVGLLTQNAPT